MKEPAPSRRAVIVALCTVLLSLFVVDYSARYELLTLGTLGFLTFLVSVVATITCSRPHRNPTK